MRKSDNEPAKTNDPKTDIVGHKPHQEPHAKQPPIRNATSVSVVVTPVSIDSDISEAQPPSPKP